MKKLKELIWLLTGRCYYCGGKTYQWSTNHEYLEIAKKRIESTQVPMFQERDKQDD